MSIGDITSGVSEIVEWQIPNFQSLGVRKIDSPPFTLEGCTWCLRVYPNGNFFNGWLAVYLCKDYLESAVKILTFSLGIKEVDGILEERIRHINYVFGIGESICGLVTFLSRRDLEKRKSDLLPSGTLTIMCRVERAALTPEEVAPNPEEVDSRRTRLVELETLSSDFKDLLNSERKCDFTINVQGNEFRVHRSVLLARSSVFRAMLEHDTAEAKSGILRIPDCDPESFGEFLGFLYSGKTEEMTYGTAYHLYATAEKYDVQQLKSFCADYLRRNLTLENVCDVVELADRYVDDELLSSAQDFFNENSYKVFLSSEWKTMLKNNVRLVDKLLSDLASSALNIS